MSALRTLLPYYRPYRRGLLVGLLLCAASSRMPHRTAKGTGVLRRARLVRQLNQHRDGHPHVTVIHQSLGHGAEGGNRRLLADSVDDDDSSAPCAGHTASPPLPTRYRE